jgi:predicted Zn-dependent protease
MNEKIIVMNVSRMPDALVETAMCDVKALRNFGIIPADAGKFLERQVALSYGNKREQVGGRELLKRINESDVGKLIESGKVILISHDLYLGRANGFCFGGYTPTEEGLGYLLMSTARTETPEFAADVLRHELGHMFGAPSEGRRNTEESLGFHCLTPYCVMQQKLTVGDALRYATQRAKSGAQTYCEQCEKDIQGFEGSH